MRISRQTLSDGPGGIGTSHSGEDVRVLRPADIRRISERHTLVVAGNAPPIIAKLRRCFDGKDGRQLKHQLDTARENRLSPNGLDDLTGPPNGGGEPAKEWTG